MKTFTSIRTEKKTIKSKKKEKKKESARAQKLMELAGVRGFDAEELSRYDLVPSKYLFGEDGLMTKPVKSALTQELEKSLQPNDYQTPLEWDQCKTAYLVDVMAFLRRVQTEQLKTFGEFCESFLAMILNICKNASRKDPCI